MNFDEEWRRRNSRMDWHSAELAALVAAGVLPKGRALDLGCGHGTESLFLAAMGWDVVGVDVDAVALRQARLRAAHLYPRPRGRIKFLRADATRFEEDAPGTFDVVVERLLYANLFPDTETPRRRGRTFRRQRRDLLTLAAWALREGGVLVMRVYDDGSSCGRAYESSFVSEDVTTLGRFFRLGREVAFRGLLTGPTEVDDAVVTGAIPLTIRVMIRNSRPVAGL